MVKDSFATNCKLTSLPIGHSDCVISMRLPLRDLQHETLFSVYASTLLADPAEKERFYADLRSLLHNVPANDKLIILGDFNARVSRNSEAWKRVFGKYGV